MKKVTFILAGLLSMVMMGCGEAGSASLNSSVAQPHNGVTQNVDGVPGLTQFPAVPAVPES